MAPVAASNALRGKITIRYPSSFRRSRLTGGVLPPSAQLNSSGTPGKARTASSASASLVSASMNSGVAGHLGHGQQANVRPADEGRRGPDPGLDHADAPGWPRPAAARTAPGPAE